jgi:hypothetical protein
LWELNYADGRKLKPSNQANGRSPQPPCSPALSSLLLSSALLAAGGGGSTVVPLFPPPLPFPLMYDLIAAASTAGKLGSDAITAAALTVSPAASAPCEAAGALEEEGSYSFCPNSCGVGRPAASASAAWSWEGSVVLRACACGGSGCVRSSATVGNGADAEMVATLEEHGSTARARKLDPAIRLLPSALGIDPDNSMDDAVVVVEAIGIAAGGSGWLWFPSYVVTTTVVSSAHLWTCHQNQTPHTTHAWSGTCQKNVQTGPRTTASFSRAANLLADRAAGGHGAAVVRAGARIALGHLLPVFPPLTPITDLRTIEKNKHFSNSSLSRPVAVHSQKRSTVSLP